MKKILLRVPRMLLVGCILLVVLVVSALAYLSASTGSLTNTFNPAGETDPTINETFENNVKTNVAVNVGNPGYAVYVRAAIVVNWEEDGKEGTYHATAPVAGTDYAINLNIADDDPWFLGSDGFYYHKAMVNSGATSNLIETCEVVAGKAPTGYHLNVEIVAQTIQALGTTDVGDTPAVEDAWKVVTVDNNGSLIPITP